MEGQTAIRRYTKGIYFCIFIVVMCLVLPVTSTRRHKRNNYCGLLPTPVTNGQYKLVVGSDVAYLVCDIGYCVFPEDLGCVTIQCQPNGQWSFPEQEVQCLQTSNLALNYVSVIQSTTSLGGLAELAVDGNRATSLTPNDPNLSCTHTVSNDANPWWETSLNGTHPIGRIVMTNRLSIDPVVPARLANLEIFVCTGVSCTMCATFPGPGAQDVSQYTVTCDNIITGDTVRIEKTGTGPPLNVLTLCEVEIYTFQSRCNGLM